MKKNTFSSISYNKTKLRSDWTRKKTENIFMRKFNLKD